MSYATIFSGTSSAPRAGVELDSTLAVGYMEADLTEARELSVGLDQMLSTLDGMEVFTELSDHFGAPKTEAERVYAQLALSAMTQGEAKFEDMTGFSMESAFTEDNHGYSMESLRSAAASFWSWICEQVAKIWKVIERFFYSLFGSIPNLRKKAKKLRKKAEDAEGKTADEKTIKISDGGANLLADGDGAKRTDASSMLKDLEGGCELIEKGEREYFGELEKLGEMIEDKLSSAEPENTDYLDDLNTRFFGNPAVEAVLPQDSNASLFKHVNFEDVVNGESRFGEKIAKRVKLIGGKAVFAAISKPTQSAQNPTAIAERARSLKVDVMDSVQKRKKLSDITVDVWTPSECDTLADHIDKFCDVAESIERGDNKGKIAKVQDKLKKTGDKFDAKLKKAKNATGDDKLSSDQTAASRAALGYAKLYADMTRSPMPSLISHYMSAFNAAIDVANKSLSEYK
jgi:hypothetical protein